MYIGISHHSDYIEVLQLVTLDGTIILVTIEDRAKAVYVQQIYGIQIRNDSK
jgi:hypothetical protein